MFREILVPLDGSEVSYRALAWARALAKPEAQRVTLLYVAPQSRHAVAYGSMLADEEIKTQALAALKKPETQSLGRQSDESTWNFDVEIRRGSVAEEILKVIDERKPDLVIMGSHGHQGWKHFFLGSMPEKVAASSKSPVLIVRNRPRWPLGRALVPIDFSPLDDESLLLAHDLMTYKALESVHLLHVVMAPVSLSSEWMVEVSDQEIQQLKIAAEQRLAQLAADHPYLKAQTRVVVGVPAAAILDEAQSMAADLIVTPTHGGQGIGQWIMGSVAGSVIQHATTNTLSFCAARSGGRLSYT
jgi:nucleotide-binding universal stress UspA family protein